METPLEKPDEALRALLKGEMARRQWKEAQLARACGLSASTLNQTLNEEKPSWPHPITLAKIARYFRMRVGELFLQGGETGRHEISCQEALQVLADALGAKTPEIQKPAAEPELSPFWREVFDLLRGVDQPKGSPAEVAGLIKYALCLDKLEKGGNIDDEGIEGQDVPSRKR